MDDLRTNLDLGGVTVRWAGSAVWWHVPTVVEVGDGRLRWELGAGGRSPERPRGLGLVERFAKLADASDDQIAAFAITWGLLLYKADRRGSCDPECSTCRLAGGRVERGWVPAHGSEPLWLWRAVASDVAAILAVAAHVHQDRQVPAARWEALKLAHVVPGAGRGLVMGMPPEPPLSLPAWAGRAGARRQMSYRMVPGVVVESDCATAGDALAQYVTTLLGWQPPTVVTWWEPDGGRMDIRPTGLLSALALQLGAAVVKRHGLAVCDGCGAGFTPARKPAASRRTFCATCRDGRVPQRLAERAYSSRRRASSR